MHPAAHSGLRLGAGMACAVLATSVALALPSLADESETSTTASAASLVGSPVEFLIENKYAAGKVLEIDNAAAMSTGPADAQWKAAAAIFSRGAKPASITAQMIEAYPVLGASNVYVLTNQAGKVLARRDNSDAYYRYLEVSDESVEEAAADPYAQWRMADAGSGYVAVQNVQTYTSGAIANLDMYNWLTADGSEIETYDAGTADVQKWLLRSTVPSTPVRTATVDPGTVPTPPAKLKAKYSWGTVHTLKDISWEMPEAAIWATEGAKVTVTGTGVGYFGEDVAVSAVYTVGSLGSAVGSTMTGYVGTSTHELRLKAPTTVKRHISGSDETVSAAVTWDWSSVTDEQLTTAGTFTVHSAASTGFDADLVVTLTAQDQVNLLRAGGVHLTYTYANTKAGLTDGNRTATGFDDWRSGGATNRVSPNRLTYYFDVPSQLTGVNVYDAGGTNNVGQVTIQYRDTFGGWVDLPGQTWPYTNAASGLTLETTNTPVIATGIRVTISSKSTSSWMTLSEIEAYGHTMAGAS